nr:hypothetical protein [Pseudomaricurvus alcaniphilus]
MVYDLGFAPLGSFIDRLVNQARAYTSHRIRVDVLAIAEKQLGGDGLITLGAGDNMKVCAAPGAAMDSGVATRPLADLEAYNFSRFIFSRKS